MLAKKCCPYFFPMPFILRARRYTSCIQFYTPAFYQTRQILLVSSSMKRMTCVILVVVMKINPFQAVPNLHITGNCTELYCMITYRSLTMRGGLLTHPSLSPTIFRPPTTFSSFQEESAGGS